MIQSKIVKRVLSDLVQEEMESCRLHIPILPFCAGCGLSSFINLTSLQVPYIDVSEERVLKTVIRILI